MPDPLSQGTAEREFRGEEAAPQPSPMALSPLLRLQLLLCAPLSAAYSLPKTRPLLRGHEHADDDMHFIYSTGCTRFQQWQSMAVLLSAQEVGQRGRITHIVTGCEDTDTAAEGKIATHQKGDADIVVSRETWREEERFAGVSVYFAPPAEMAKTFPWMNKPFAFAHWLKRQPPKESIIVIIDPDEYFIRPLNNKPKSAEQLLPPFIPKPCPSWWFKQFPAREVVEKFGQAGANVVKPGHPVSAM